MNQIAVVVPTIRREKYQQFRETWEDLFTRHKAKVVTVWDGDEPVVECGSTRMTRQALMGEDSDLVADHTAGCRNLGFAYVAKHLPEITHIITLDDDLEPLGDPIQDHLDILGQKRPISWMPVVDEFYTRGFPYGIRDEAEVIISHGVWDGVLDVDAPTQLLLAPHGPYHFPRIILPRGCLAALSGMNLGFLRKALPYVFYAPQNMALWGFDRMEDIWGLIDAKRECDRDGYAIATGYSIVLHARASNVFVNLAKEAVSLGLNEAFWQGDESHPYFAFYRDARERWQAWVNAC